MLGMPSHTYEEIRSIAVEVLASDPKGAFVEKFMEPIGQKLLQRRGKWPVPQQLTGINYHGAGAYIHPDDTSTILEIFWDLFRQGAITLGINASQPGWPAFRLTRFGQQIANGSPYRFHNTQSYIALIKTYAPNISADAIVYLEEAIASFYADCMLASTVMLGVAAEVEFIRLLTVASNNPTHGQAFSAVTKPQFIGQKVKKFVPALQAISPHLPKEATEDLDTNFLMIQSVLRVARNEAGHPTEARPQREQVFNNLQLFAPFSRQIERLRDALT